METAQTNFFQVIPNSQMYTDLRHIENSLEFGGDVIDREHMLIGIKNTIKAGYKIVPPEPELRIDDIVLYKTDSSKGIPILGRIVNIKMDGDVKIYVLKNLNALTKLGEANAEIAKQLENASKRNYDLQDQINKLYKQIPPQKIDSPPLTLNDVKKFSVWKFLRWRKL